jgi:hypothetical protein
LGRVTKKPLQRGFALGYGLLAVILAVEMEQIERHEYDAAGLPADRGSQLAEIGQPGLICDNGLAIYDRGLCRQVPCCLDNWQVLRAPIVAVTPVLGRPR